MPMVNLGVALGVVDVLALLLPGNPVTPLVGLVLRFQIINHLISNVKLIFMAQGFHFDDHRRRQRLRLMQLRFLADRVLFPMSDNTWRTWMTTAWRRVLDWLLRNRRIVV